MTEKEVLERVCNRNLIKTMERMWVENTPKINVFNYFYYRYFTNEFELYCLKTKFQEEKR